MAPAGAAFVREAAAAFSGASVSVKAVTLCLLITYVGYLIGGDAVVRALAVTPGHFWPPHFWIWTAFTHCFLEVHLWEVALDVAVVVLVGKLLEPLWGAIEMVVFFMVVNVGVATVSAFFYYLLYMASFDTSLLFHVHIHGLAGYLAGVAVAVKQVMPDYVLHRSPLGKMTNGNIPLLLFVCTLLLWALKVVAGSYCTMFGSGLLVSWVYLRFYQVHGNGSKGDMADSFAFHTFFPNVLQPPLALLGGGIFTLLVRARVCRKPVRKFDMGSGTGASISISLPGVESHDTERRRQIALKALSERLNQTQPGDQAGTSGPAQPQSWPNLEEEEEGGARGVGDASGDGGKKGHVLESVHVTIEQRIKEQQDTNANHPEGGETEKPSTQIL